MANFTTSEDIIQQVLARVGEIGDGTSDFDADVLAYLNLTYQKIWTGGAELNQDVNELWRWLKSAQGVLKLEPKYDTGTAAVTQESATVTISSSITDDVAGWFFKLDDSSVVYQVSAHGGSSVTLTLDGQFMEDTDAAASYKLFQLEYDLAADVMTLTGPLVVFLGSGRAEDFLVEMIPENEMNRYYPLAEIEEGIPDRFCFIDENTIRLNKYPKELERATYPYMKIPDDLTDSAASIPLIPRKHRHILFHGTCAEVFEDKNDDRAVAEFQRVSAALAAMAKENRNTMQRAAPRTYGQIAPRQGRLLRNRKPLRTESGLIL